MLLDGCPDYKQGTRVLAIKPGTTGDNRPMTDYPKPKIAELIEAR